MDQKLNTPDTFWNKYIIVRHNLPGAHNRSQAKQQDMSITANLSTRSIVSKSLRSYGVVSRAVCNKIKSFQIFKRLYSKSIDSSYSIAFIFHKNRDINVLIY